MAEFKVVLTVKDRYGNIKEVDGGTINVGLTDAELDRIEATLPFDDYLKKSEIDYLATDSEVEQATKNTVKFDDFKLTPETTEEEGN